jgi:hypothetical protein
MEPLDTNWGGICARNLALTTKFTFFVRFGVELQVQPGSTLSPHLRLSPQYDSRALKTYFAIARELKDAYPADYNDWGKLWNVVKGVASSVLPVVSALGPVGAGVGALGGLAMKGIDAATAAKKKRAEAAAQSKNASTVSEGDKEIARKIISQSELNRKKLSIARRK